MDASCSVVNAQSKKFCKGKNANNGKDTISNLPETLISHILSILPTKDAVRTSVLSTKWKYKWTSITNLHFDDTLLYCQKRLKKLHFMNFVERVLLQTGNLTIHNFYLRCKTGYDASRVDAWISDVIRRKVKRLSIHYLGKNFNFPCCLFSCNSLTELNLSMYCTLKVPTSICFPSLKILQLFRVTFLNEHSSETRQLLFSFPALAVFDVTYCTWLNVKIVDIDAPALDSVIMGFNNFEWVVDGSLRSHDCVIKISGPVLTKFNWHRFSSEDIILTNPLSVRDAMVLHVSRQGDMRDVGLRACRFLKQISSVELLTLSTFTIEAIAHAENLEDILPSFDKLIQLSLNAGNLVVSRTFIELLRRSPVLEYIVFESGISHQLKHKFAQETLPHCFQSHLKGVAFLKFCGKGYELDLVKFFLENAMVLEEIIVSADNSRWDPKTDKEEVKKQILSFPTGSSEVTIMISRFNS